MGERESSVLEATLVSRRKRITGALPRLTSERVYISVEQDEVAFNLRLISEIAARRVALKGAFSQRRRLTR